MSLPPNILQTSAADINALVTARVVEGTHLDLKRELPRAGEQGRHELLADASAFANASGGDVVYGIEEDGEGRASTVVPLMGNPDEETRRIQDVLLNGIEPRIPGIQVHSVPVPGGCVVLVRVPQSWAGPHRVKSNQHFFIREGARKRQLDVPEIRGLFLRSAQQANQIRDFRTERLGKILSGEAPHALVAGPLEVVHLVPTQAALGVLQVDPVQFINARVLPALGARVPYARLNVDGALGVRNPNPAGTHGYSQIFRNGFFESVKVLSLQNQSERAILPSINYEQELIQLVQLFRAELENLGIGTEMTCMLSITNANQVQIGVDRFRHELEDHQGKFDRQMLILPDVLLPADLGPEQALRPLFDLVWQSAGIERSRNYNAQGEWVPPVR